MERGHNAAPVPPGPLAALPAVPARPRNMDSIFPTTGVPVSLKGQVNVRPQ